MAGRPRSAMFWIMIDFISRVTSPHAHLFSSTHFLSFIASFPPLPPSALFTTNISSKHNNRGHQPVARRQLQEQQRVCVCDDHFAAKASRQTNRTRLQQIDCAKNTLSVCAEEPEIPSSQLNVHQEDPKKQIDAKKKCSMKENEQENKQRE